MLIIVTHSSFKEAKAHYEEYRSDISESEAGWVTAASPYTLSICMSETIVYVFCSEIASEIYPYDVKMTDKEFREVTEQMEENV